MTGIKRIINSIAVWNPRKYILYCVFGAFVLLFSFVSLMHEPWGDEAQAWLIARDASYYDMFFVMPHYEGHPPVWWFILSIPAKLHVPYETALWIVTLLISLISVYLIIFRSPFCPAFRIVLPFSFFIFYQYGVIARPYCLTVLSFCLAAFYYNKKDSVPFRFVFSLVVMCSSSGFGIVMAGGIAAVWCIEIISEFKSISDIYVFFRSKRFFSLLFLLMCAIVIIMLIIPADDIFVWINELLKKRESENPGYIMHGRLIALIYMLFMIPADCMVSSSYGIDSDLISFCNKTDMTGVLLLLIPGLLILMYFLDLSYKKGKLKAFIIPYLLFTVFAIYIYFNIYHIGIISVFFIFVMWICIDSEDKRESLIDKCSRKISFINLNTVEQTFMIVFSLVNLSWTVFCSYEDVKYDYDFGKQIYEYITQNDYEDKSIMFMWKRYEIGGELKVNTNVVYDPVSIAPYFPKNIFMNLNCGNPEMAYVFHKESDSEKDISIWKEKVPDILIGQVIVRDIYGDKVKFSDYSLDTEISYRRVWKFTSINNEILIYKKK